MAQLYVCLKSVYEMCVQAEQCSRFGSFKGCQEKGGSTVLFLRLSS